MWYIWLIAAGIFFIVEIITVGFLVFWLGVSALLAMVVSLFTDNLFIQTLVFVISSCILIPLTKPLVNKFISKDDDVKTNAFSLINKVGIVTMDILPNSIGQVKVNGELWSAQSDTDIELKIGQKVKILKIDEEKNNSRLEITIHEGKNRQVRKMCEAIGLSVIALKREGVGDLTCEGVERGKWRYLTDEEVKNIMNV